MFNFGALLNNLNLSSIKTKRFMSKYYATISEAHGLIVMAARILRL